MWGDTNDITVEMWEWSAFNPTMWVRDVGRQ